MRFRKVVNRPVEVDEDGVRVAGGVNAVVSANVNERGPSRSRVSSRQRIVQRGGKTVVDEREVVADDGAAGP
ncbi:MAG TPA: hypothetical protein VG452_10295 [Egibacteraceae bacterium]|nr:hypothetical protein [Actinomycetota bacterium]HWB72600.1 hypothetical protein [Egibacteraceae bacterium]